MARTDFGPTAAPGEIDARDVVAAINASAAFNRWCGFEVLAAGGGRAELKLAWRDELGQYAGFLHAALIGGLIDTACGFAAVTVSGRVLASHVSFNCLAPAVGDAFVARARVVKAGRAATAHRRRVRAGRLPRSRDDCAERAGLSPA